MKVLFRLLTACLLACMVLPQPARAGGDKGTVAYDLGEKYFTRKDYRKALKFYEKALSHNVVRAHYRIGLIYEATGRDRDALRHFQRFVEIGPQDSQQVDTAQRIWALEERLKKDANLSAELLERGKSLFAQGKYREAEEVLRQAASRDESEPEIHFCLGEIAMELKEYGRARKEYEKAKRCYSPPRPAPTP